MNKKAFTLTELIAVIVILSLIALLAVPIFMNVIEENKQKALTQQIKNLENIAHTWVVSNDEELNYTTTGYILTLEKLKEDGFVKINDIKNPVTNNNLTGHFLIKWDDLTSQYIISYIK